MTGDELPEEPLKDGNVVELEQGTNDDVATRAVDKLDLRTKRELAKYAIRCGLGPHFLQQTAHGQGLDGTDVGALMSVTFDTDTDPLHDDLLLTLTEWAGLGRDSIPEHCPMCGCSVWSCSGRVIGGSLEPQTPVECDRCGFDPDVGGGE